MPHVSESMKKELRPVVRDVIEALERGGAYHGGIAYVVYSILQAFTTYKDVHFREIAAVVGSAQAGIDEFKRVDLAEYENEAIKRNGAADDFVRVHGRFGYEDRV